MSVETSEFEPCGFFVLRAPLVSVGPWAAWGDTRDLAALRAFVQAQLERQEVREAIAVASPSLLEGLVPWLRDPESENGQKVERALVRYLSRMATRPTPFGLFAGCGVGTIGDHTRVRVGSIAAHTRSTRLDNDYLDQLGRRLTASPAIRSGLRYHPNTSLYEQGGKIRYIEPRHGGRGRTYDLVALDPNEYVTVAVERARQGGTAREIAARLIEFDPDVSMDEAVGFVDGLIDRSILISELEPAVTGAEPVHGTIEGLRRIEGAAAELEVLQDVVRTLAAIDAEPLRVQSQRVQAVTEQLVGLCDGVEPARLLQVDMQLALDHATLDRRVIPELVAAATLVAQVCPDAEEQHLRRFCRDFEARYERQQVPLLECLDEDTGIGFGKLRAEGNDPEPMLAGIDMPAPLTRSSGPAWGAFEQMLARKLEALEPGAHELRLVLADFDAVPRRAVQLPDACAVNVTFAARDADAMANGDYRALLHVVDGPSCANWLGRFCHADRELHTRVEAALRREEALRPDAVFAEIVHLPEGRIGNVLLRPVLRQYEIPFLGRSGAAPEQQLSPDDLVVTVWDGRVVLESKRLQKEVIPRLSSAHGFTSITNIGVYRFLCALQTSGRSVRTSWNWGALEHHSTFLPRVTLGKVVLSLARWSLAAHHLAPIDVDTRDARWDAMQALRVSLRMPRVVCVADADNLLCVDFDNVLSVESAAQLLRKRRGAQIVEMFPEPDGAWVESPQGALTHEMIIPIVRKATAEVTDTPRPWLQPAPPRDTPRVFAPGSEWLYLKLYASPRSCDDALLRLAPVIRQLVAAGSVQRWFFLRMSDETGWHLRLRLQGPPDRMPTDALALIHGVVAPMIAERRVWKMQLDSYHREVEHWGGVEGVLLAEEFLARDSEAVLAILEAYADDPATLATARWQLALRGVDGLWAGLGLDPSGRQRQATRCREGFVREFGLGAHQEHQLSTQFRSARREIEAVFGPQSPWTAGEAALQRRDEALAPVFARFHELERTGALNRPVLSFADRFSHLHVNRILRSMPREQELVTVDFLARYLRSAVARRSKTR